MFRTLGSILLLATALHAAPQSSSAGPGTKSSRTSRTTYRFRNRLHSWANC
jgi:hypothetical protein